MKSVVSKIAILSIIFLTGCGTIFKGSNADVRLNSSPSGATVIINDINRGLTPLTLSLQRSKDYVVTFQKDGYEDIKVEINKKFDFPTTILGNIVFGGIIGLVVDFATGAAYSLTPADIQANMEALQSAGFFPDENLMTESDIHVFMLTPEQWKIIQSNSN